MRSPCLKEKATMKVMRGAFKWVQDFRMDLKNNVEDQFLFVIDDTSAKYSSVGSHFDMAKVDVEEVQPHEATVVLRDNI